MNFFVRLGILRQIIGIKIHLVAMNIALASVERDLEKSKNKSSPTYINRAKVYESLKGQKAVLDLMLIKFRELIK